MDDRSRTRGLRSLLALALVAPVTAFAQNAVPADTPPVPVAQAVPGGGGAGAELPGTVLPGESPPGLGPEPADLTRYAIAAGIGETDNVTLSATHPISQTLAATILDLDLQRTGSRLDASAVGDFTDLDFLQGAYSNQLLGRFDGLATAKLWSDRLRWAVADDYGEQQADPFAPITPVNLERVNVFSTGPDLTLRPSDSTFVNLGARYLQNSYQTSPFDGHNVAGFTEFGRQLSSLSSLSVAVQAEALRFDDTIVNTDYDRREAYGHYVLQGARTSVDAQLGVTQANDVGSSWKSSPLVRLLLARRISPFSRLTLTGGREYTDAGGSFSSLRGGAGGGITVAPVTQTTANAVRDYGSAGWLFQRQRTTLGLTADWEHDRYDLHALFDTTRTAIGLNLGRALTPKLSATLSGSVDRYDYFNQGFTDNFGTASAGLLYRIGRWLVVYARYDHAFRRTTGAPGLLLEGAGYDENRVFVMLGYSPHADGQGQSFGGVAAP